MIEQSLVVLKRKTLLDIIIDAFLFTIVITAIIILTLSILIIVKKNLYPDKVPDIMGIKPFIVLTGSMEPTIKAGDLVIVKEVEKQELKQGDIIAFRHTKEDVVLIHRIERIDIKDGETILKTKGDNNQAEDEFNVEYKNVEGLYTVRFGKLGTIAMFIRSPQGLAISVLSIITIFCLWQLIKRIRREKITRRRLKECQEVIEELKKEGMQK